jgi:hypothetical protein
VSVVVATLVAAGPAGAGEDLRGARDRLAGIEDAIERRTAELAGARVALAAADARVEAAAGRLAAVTVLREQLETRLAEVQARLDAAQAELDAVAADLFMRSGGAGAAGGVVSAVLGASSIAELGDRIEFASAGAAGASELAARAEVARAELEARHAATNVLVGAEAMLLGTIRVARDELTSALARTHDAMARLEREREHAVELVDHLAAEAGGLAAVDLSSLGEALRGADGATYGEWASLFLQLAGAPTCRNNLVIMVAWQAAEGTQAAWNPLATTHPMPGSTSFNSVGVQNFVSLRQGLQGTWETIENGWEVYGYGPIVASLRACAPSMVTARAINASSWCPGCTNGMYVLNVVPHVEANLETYLAI